MSVIAPAGGSCRDCGHDFGLHLVVEVFPATGYVRCPVPDCRCWGTWSAGPRRSTERERRELRTLLLLELASHGLLDTAGVPRIPRPATD